MALLFDTWKKWRNKNMAKKLKETLKEMKETNAESAESILKYIKDNDIVDLSYVRKQIEMAKKDEILKKHPYKISCGKDGFWRTYLPDETKAQGRRQIKKKTEDAVKKEVIEYWEEKLDTYTFHDYFDKWMEVKIACGISENTVYKYQCDYKRFFTGTDFEKADIRNINSEHITIFMINTIRDKKLKRKAGSALWGYIAGTFKSAFINRIITENPCMYVDTQLFRRHYNTKQVAVEHRIFNRDESGKLLQQLRKDHIDKPDYIPSYAVELATMTGMRVGDDDDKIRLNQRKPSKYKGLSRFGPEKNLQRINKFMKERPIFYKNLIQMKENFRFYLRCFYCITKVVILQFNSENRTELARNG